MTKSKNCMLWFNRTINNFLIFSVNKDPDSDHPVAVQVPPPKDIADAIEKASETIDRTVGQKHKIEAENLDTSAAEQQQETSNDLPMSKKLKLSDSGIDTESEVESILSGKVLDTDIPGLEEFMSSESKFLCLWINCKNKLD